MMDEVSDRRTCELDRLGATHPIPITVEDIVSEGDSSSAGTRDSPGGVVPDGPSFADGVSSPAIVRDGSSKRHLSY